MYTPGPVEVPPEVLLAMARPVIHHRTPAFAALFDRVRRALAGTFLVPGEVLVLAGSGTAAMEALAATCLREGDEVVVGVAGRFGERWLEIAARLRLRVHPVEEEWGRALDPGRLAEAVKAKPKARALLLTHSETSTGVLHDLEAITRELAGGEALVFADAVTSLGATELKPALWGVDGVVSGSQKALMCPPGLAFATLSERAWELARRPGGRAFYLDLAAEREAQADGATAFTPAVSLIHGLEAALALLHSEGLESSWNRHHRLTAALRAGLEAAGCQAISQRQGTACVAVKPPPGIAAGAVIAWLRDHGVTIAAGQGRLAGQILRVSLMGRHDDLDAITALAAIEAALRECGAAIPRGAAVAAGWTALAEPWPVGAA